MKDPGPAAAEGGRASVRAARRAGKAKACLEAILRLSWCVGVGPFRRMARAGEGRRSAGLRAVSTSPSVRPRGLVYEGEVSLGKGLERLPRNRR